MKKSLPQARRHAHGGAAVEFAVLLPLMIIMVAVPLFFGRILWHYNVAQKAAYDAVRFLAAVPAGEFRIQGPGGTEAPMAAVARAIVRDELAELNPDPGGAYAPGVDVQCDGGTCFGFQIPTRIRVRVTLAMDDPFFHEITSAITGGEQFLLMPTVTMNYAEN